MKTIKKVIIACFAILAMISLTSFTYAHKPVRKQVAQKVVKAKKKSMAKKVVAKPTTEISETRIEITPEYQALAPDESETVVEVTQPSQKTYQPAKMAVSDNNPNPNKVNYFFKSKDSNLYEVK